MQKKKGLAIGNTTENGYLQTITIRWAAPEVFERMEFSTASDVFAFAITLYEIFTHGGPPYVGIKNEEVRKLVEKGFRMPCPLDCSNELYELMERCWHQDKAERPKFADVSKQLRTLHARANTSVPAPPTSLHTSSTGEESVENEYQRYS
jgi:serine/threonine protein kinase